MKITPHINSGKEATLVPGTVKLLHQRKKKIAMGIRRAAGLTWNRRLMRVNNSAGKGTSGMIKFGSVICRMNMKLGSNVFLFENQTQLLKRLQRVIDVDGATHSQKDGVEGNGGSLEDGAEAFMLLLRGAQLVLRSSVLTVLDLDEVDVTLESAEVFGSVLSGEGGSAGGAWRCC